MASSRNAVADDTAGRDGLSQPRRAWAALAIWLGIAVVVLDSSIANVALPSIARQLHTTPAASIWVLNAYQIAIVIALLPLAALGERIGYRRVYLGGLAVFIAGSLGCALSQSLPALIGSRLVQGLGASGVMAVNGALVRYTYPQSALGRGIGLNALVVASAGVLGPTVASGILALASWHWLFAINLPIGAVNLLLASRSLPPSDRSDQLMDWRSAVLNTVMFSLFFLGVDALRGHAIAGLAEIMVAVLVGIGLVRRESRLPRPLIPIDLLRIPIFALSIAASVCAFAAYMLAFTALPFYFEQTLGRDQVQTGLLITPWPLALALVAPFAGRLADRVSAGVLGGAGLVLMALGLILMATVGQAASDSAIVWRMALCGLGFGLFQSPNNRTMLLAAPRSRSGAAGGMLATARLTGTTIGSALTALIFGLAARHAEFIELSIAAALAVLAAIVSLARMNSTDKPRDPGPGLRPQSGTAEPLA